MKPKSKKLRRIKALIIKEFYQIIRDPSSLAIAILFPLLLLFIYGVGVSLDMNDVKIGLVLQDTNPDVQSFAQSLRDSRFFTVTIAQQPSELTQDLLEGNIYGIVIVPFYFSEYKDRSDEQGPIFVIADGSAPNTAAFVQNYLLAAWQNWEQQQAISNGKPSPPLVQFQPRFWYNEELNSRNFLVPGSIAIIMTLIGTLLTALMIAREWERGTMEALMATPVTISEILWGKLIPYFCLGLISMTLCTIVGHFIYGVPFRGTFLALLLVSVFFLVVALGMGLLISTIARNQFTASQIALVTAFLPAFILSGFIFEITTMPQVIQFVTYCLPARYFVSSLQTLFLVGNIWSLLLHNILALGLFIVVIFTILKIKTVKRLD